MSTLTFADVVDDSVLAFLESQARLGEWVESTTGPGYSFKVDLDRQQITFVPKLHKRDEVVCRMHLIGSVAESPRSALWAWANPVFAEHQVATLSERVREFGQSRQIAELAEAQIDLPDADLDIFATQMASVAWRITGMPTGLVVPNGQTRVVTLLDPANFSVGAPSAVNAPSTLVGPIGTMTHDHRRALQGFAQARQLPHQWAPGFAALSLRYPDGELNATFDEQGRLADLTGTAGGQQPG